MQIVNFNERDDEGHGTPTGLSILLTMEPEPARSPPELHEPFFPETPEAVESRMSLSTSLQCLNEQMSPDEDDFEAEAEALARQVVNERSQSQTFFNQEMAPSFEPQDTFANEVSENLLLECRRQQVALREAQRAANARDEDILKLRDLVTALESRLSGMSVVEEGYKEEIWELQIKLQDAHSQIEKRSRPLPAPKETVDTHANEVELLQARESELVAQLAAFKSKYGHQVDDLRQQLAEAHEHIVSLQSNQETVEAPVNIPVVESKSIFDDIELPPIFEKSPPISPIKDIGATAHEDTANSAMMHAQRQIYALKQQLAKERQQRRDRDLTQSANASTSSNTPIKKKKRPSAKARPKSKRRSASGQEPNEESDEVSDFDDENVIGTDGLSLNEEFDDPLTMPVESSLDFNDQSDFFRTISAQEPGQFETEDPSPALANEFLSADDLAARAADLGLAVIDPEILDSLQRKVSHPSNEELEEMCAVRGYVPVQAEIHNELTEPSKQTIARFAKLNGLELCSTEEYNALKHPEYTPKDIAALAAKHSSVVLTEAEYADISSRLEHSEKMLSKRELANASVAARRDHFESILKSPSKMIKSPTSTRVSQTLTSLGYVPVPSEEYKRLVASQSVFTPSKTDIIRGAKAFNLATVPVDEYRGLVRRSNNASSSGSPKQRSSPLKAEKQLDDEDDVQVVPTHYLESLRQLVENPAKEEVIKLADKFNMDLVDRAPEALEKHVRDRGFRLSTKTIDEEFNDEIASRGIPTTDVEIISRAKQLGLIEKLSDEEIVSRAKVLDPYTPPSDDEILKTAHALESIESLKARIEGHGFMPVLMDNYVAMQRQIESPSDTELEYHASKAGLRLSKKTLDEEFNERIAELGIPTTDEQILAKSRSLGLIDPPSDEHIKSRGLSLGLVHPLSDKDVLEKARILGLVDALSTEELRSQALGLGLVHPPTEEEIKSQAKSLGLVDPISAEDIRSQALGLGLVHPPTEEEIKSQAKSLGLVDPISAEEIRSQALDLGLAEPLSKEEIIKESRVLGLVDPLTESEIIERSRSFGLREPFTDDEVISRARTLGLTEPLKEDQIIALAKPLLPVDALLNLVSANGYVSLMESEVSELRRKAHQPTKDEIIAHCSSENMKPVLVDEHKELLRKAYKPTLDELSVHAAKHSSRVTTYSQNEEFDQVLAVRNLKAVDPAYYDDLVRKTTQPTVTDMRELGSIANVTTLDNEEYAELQRKAIQPTVEELSVLASAHDLVQIPRPQYEEVSRKAANPDIDELRSHSENQGYYLLSLTDYDTLKTPPLETLHKLAAAHKNTILPVEEVSELQRKLNRPTLEEITNMASGERHKLLSDEEYQKLLARSTELEMKSEAEKARTLQDVVRELDAYGFSAVSANDQAALERRLNEPTVPELEATAHKLGHVSVEKMKYEELLRKIQDPTIQEVEAYCTLLGLPSKDEEYTSRARSLGLVDPPTSDEIKAAGKSHGLIDPLSDDEIVTRAHSLGLVHPLGNEEITDKALELGLIRPLEENEIIGRARALGLVDRPNDADIIASAESLGLVHPLADAEIKTKALDLGLVHPLSDTAVKSKALTLGLCYPLSDEEIMAKAHELEPPLTDDEIAIKARTLGMTDPISDNDIVAKARTLGLTDKLSDDEIRSKARDLGLASPLNEAEIIEAAKKLGLLDSSNNEEILSRARDIGLTDPLTDHEITSKALGLGLINPLSNVEVCDKARLLGLVDPLSEEQILDKARSLGLISPLSDDEIIARARSLGLTDKLSDEDVIARARNLGMIMPLTEEEILDKSRDLGMVKPLDDDDLMSKARALGLVDPLKEGEVVAKAKALGLVDSPSEDEIKSKALELGLISPHDSSSIQNKARELGLVDPLSEDEIIARAKQLGLAHPLNESQILDKARSLGLISPPTDKETIERAHILGLVQPYSEEEIVLKANELGLVKPLRDEEIVEAARGLGMADIPSDDDTIARAKALGLTARLSDDDIAKRAINMGFIDQNDNENIIVRARAFGLVDSPSDGDIKARATTLGLFGPLSDDEILAKAESLGLVKPMNKDQIIEQAQALGYAKPLTDEEVKQRASGLGFPVNSTQIIKAARSLGLRYPASEVEIIAKAKSLGYEKLNEGEIRKRAKALGLADASTVVQASELSSVTNSPRRPSVPYLYTSGIATSSRNADAVKRAHEAEQRAMRSPVRQDHTHSLARETPVRTTPQIRRYEIVRQPPRALNHQNSIETLKRPPSMRGTPQLSPASSVANVDTPVRKSASSRVSGTQIKSKAELQTGFYPQQARAVSVSSNDSLNSHSTIAETPVATRNRLTSYVTQLVIGDCLYKYTKGISLSGITGGRHERFFWVHHNSLTIYWDKDNPACSPPSGHMPKSAKIVDVEEILDNNPIPTGLYRKSLIIRTVHRDLKITCPNRTRHRVWYQALRYLIDQERQQ